MREGIHYCYPLSHNSAGLYMGPFAPSARIYLRRAMTPSEDESRS